MTTHFPILGLDFGTVRIGLAIARTWIAEPYLILTQTDQVIAQIKDICQKEQVRALVVGVSEGQMEVLSRQFGHKLESELGLPVIFFDETLTSHDSQIKLRQIGKKSRHIDHYAACQILQTYLDTIDDGQQL